MRNACRTSREPAGPSRVQGSMKVSVRQNGQVPGQETEQVGDDVFVARAKAGDKAAFNELVLRYQHRLFNFTYRFLGSATDAEEVVQEAFLKAYRGIARFRSEAKFSTWLFQITKNLAINRYHRRRRRPLDRFLSLVTAREEDGPVLELPNEDDSPDDSLLRGERRAVLEAAIKKIDPTYRTALVLRDVEGLDYAEIAEILEVPVGTVKSRIHRARSRVQTLITPYMEAGEL